MRRWMIVALVLVCAPAVQAQVLWVGAGTGTSWEWQAETAPDQDFLHASDQALAGFVAMPLAEDTLLRLRVGDIQHDLRLATEDVSGTLRGYTLGVDYFVPGVIGEALFSAGFGAYEMRPKGDRHDDLKERKFGWYFGVGEWFTVTRRTRVTAEVIMHRTNNLGTPVLVTLNAGLAFSF